jgi:riboflavin kinase / FMN adenylyltransferase
MALGFFDGVHLGHQTLLKQAGQLAKQKKIDFSVMTFSPHPDEVIKGDMDRNYLTLLDEKLKKLESIGVDQVFVVKFDRDFASLSAVDFVRQYIINFNVKHVVVGFDFTFGFKAKGDTDLLRKIAKDKCFDLTVVPKKTYNNEKISSTLVRKTLNDGEVNIIPYYLGTHYEVTMQIDEMADDYLIDGRRIRVLVSEKTLLPKPGIYHVKVIDGNDMVNAIFLRFDSKEKANEIRFLTHRGTVKSKEFRVKFVNRISFNEALSV